MVGVGSFKIKWMLLKKRPECMIPVVSLVEKEDVDGEQVSHVVSIQVDHLQFLQLVLWLMNQFDILESRGDDETCIFGGFHLSG
jgi:hypothetical protein